MAERFAASTDMGNVSHTIPSIHPMIGLDSFPAVNHQPEFAAHCATPVADQATIDGAVAMAWTAIDAAADATLSARLRT
jgi:metal-dependent amidase/aminoacylase/carboxypeptidase family protein